MIGIARVIGSIQWACHNLIGPASPEYGGQVLIFIWLTWDLYTSPHFSLISRPLGTWIGVLVRYQKERGLALVLNRAHCLLEWLGQWRAECHSPGKCWLLEILSVQVARLFSLSNIALYVRDITVQPSIHVISIGICGLISPSNL